MKKIDFKTFRTAFEKHNESFLKEWNINMKLGGITYDDLGFRSHIRCDYQGEDMEETRKEEFERIAKAMDIDPSWYGMEFTTGSQILKITGLNPKAPKNCITMECKASGARYRGPKGYVQKFIKNQIKSV